MRNIESQGNYWYSYGCKMTSMIRVFLAAKESFSQLFCSPFLFDYFQFNPRQLSFWKKN